MIEQHDNRGLEEALELEGTQNEFWKSRKSKVKYKRSLLLGLTKVEVCRKLPCDFDLSILRQFDGGSDAKVQRESICGKPSDHSPLQTPIPSLAFPRVSWDDHHLYTQSKESHLQRNCSSERKDASQLLPHKSDKDAGILHYQIEKSDLFQLSKTVNPYRPPHLNKKKPQPLPTYYDARVESSGESDHKGSADDVTGHVTAGNGFSLAGDSDLTKEPLGRYEAFRRNNEETEVTESSERLDECGNSWREIEGNEVIAGLMEDNEPSFNIFWAEILEMIHLQQEPNVSSTNSHVDSELEIHFSDEGSLTSVDTLLLPDNLNSLNSGEINLPDEESLTSVDTLTIPDNLNNLDLDEINLPDEDSLITVDDLIAPEMRKDSKSAYGTTKEDDRSKRPRCRARGPLPPPHIPHSQTYGPGFLPLTIAPNGVPYMPSFNSFPQPGIYPPFCPETSLQNPSTNGPFSYYSLLHQPYIFPNHLLFDTTYLDPRNPMAVYDVDAMQRTLTAGNNP